MTGFVVLNFLTWQLTINCVDSIIDTYKCPKKIIVVDNASPNESYEQLTEFFSKNHYSEVELIKSDLNGGFSRGNNIGIKRCIELGIKYAIITNNDIIFEEDAVIKLVADIGAFKNAVMVAPKILDSSRKVTSLPWKAPQSYLQFLNIKQSKALVYKESELSGIKKVYMVSGCCFAVDVMKFADMGAIDEGTFLYMEEGTMSCSAAKKKYDILYDSQSLVIHNHSVEAKGGLFIDGEMIKSSLYYWRKYENARKLQLYFIRFFFILRCLLKIVTGRVNKKGFFKMVKETHNKLKCEIKKIH